MTILESKVIKDWLAEFATPQALIELHDGTLDADSLEVIDCVYFEMTGNILD